MRRALLLLLLLGCASVPVRQREPQRFPGTPQFGACKADCDTDGAPGALVIENEVTFDCWCKWESGQVSRPGKHPSSRTPEET